MDPDDLELMDDLMMVLMQSRIWYRMTTRGPGFAAAQAELDALLDQVPADLRDSLDDAISQDLARVSDAAVCYGLRVARLIPAAAHWAERSPPLTRPATKCSKVPPPCSETFRSPFMK